MNSFEGRVEIEDDKVPVTVDLDGSLRLSANGTEIGEWSPGEFYITDDGDGVYTITAENEVLTFIPSDPEIFAHTVIEALPQGRHEAPAHRSDRQMAVSPMPFSELTGWSRSGIYLLAAGTIAVGIWAAVRVFS